MAKKKKKKSKKGGGIGSKGAVGAGLLGGFASVAAKEVIKSAVDELISAGKRRVLGRRTAVSEPVEQDLGFVLLHLLATGDVPLAVTELCARARAGLVTVLDAIQSLRRGRLVTFANGRRNVQLTPLGRETLDALTASTDADDQDAPEDPGPSVATEVPQDYSESAAS